MTCVLPILLILSGLIIMIRGLAPLISLKRIKKWHKVNITINEARLLSELDVIKYARLTYYYPVIEYSYETNGTLVQNNKVSVDKKGIWVDSIDEARKLMDEITSNKIAYINPDNTAESIIIPHVSERRISHYKALIVSGAILSTLGIMFCLTLAI